MCKRPEGLFLGAQGPGYGFWLFRSSFFLNTKYRDPVAQALCVLLREKKCVCEQDFAGILFGVLKSVLIPVVSKQLVVRR